MKLTEYECDVLKDAATGDNTLPDSDRFWRSVNKLKKRGFLVGIKRGATTYLVPTPEAIIARLEATEQSEAEK